jgi:hypothetical protein
LLALENQGRGQGGDAKVRQALAALTAVDGTVLRAVPRMAWAPAGGSGTAIKLLLMLWTGQRPNKRRVESLQWYWTGMATEEDLVTLLQRAGCKKKS